MNKLLTASMVLSIASNIILAQAPTNMSYQAVIRDSNNSLVTTSDVGMQLSILKGSATGIPVYVESHTTTSNENGLVSIEIGNGTVINGVFDIIDWSRGPYFIKTETDPDGGTSYTITGTSQLLTVPYALYSNSSDRLSVDTVDQFAVKVNKGEHAFFDVSSTNEIYNNASDQFAIVGASKDNHNPLDPNDTRAFMVHADAQRQLTKTVVCEPGELTISVQNDSLAALGQNPFQAVMQMRDAQKEILIGNAYVSPEQNNALVLGEDYSAMYFTDDDGVTSRMLAFQNEGIALIKDDSLEMFSVEMNGTVNIKDAINLSPRVSAPSDPTKGTMYFNDITNKLMVFDGIEWQACW